MGWYRYQKLFVAFDFFIELLKIISAILILYGALLDRKFDLLGKVGIVLLGFAGFAVSQYLKNNMRVLINRITSPMVIPIEYGTIVTYHLNENNLIGMVKIKALFVKENILQ